MMTEKNDYQKWAQTLEKAYIDHLPKKKKTLAQHRFIAVYEGREAAGAFKRSFLEKIR